MSAGGAAPPPLHGDTTWKRGQRRRGRRRRRKRRRTSSRIRFLPLQASRSSGQLPAPTLLLRLAVRLVCGGAKGRRPVPWELLISAAGAVRPRALLGRLLPLANIGSSSSSSNSSSSITNNTWNLTCGARREDNRKPRAKLQPALPALVLKKRPCRHRGCERGGLHERCKASGLREHNAFRPPPCERGYAEGALVLSGGLRGLRKEVM